MGLYQQLYVGPYVECTQREGTRTATVTTCLNVKCENHPKPPFRRNAQHDDKFCAKCGGPIGPFDITVKARLSPYEVVGDDLAWINPDEGEKMDNRRLCLGTNTSKVPRDFTPEPSGAHLDVTTIDVNAEVAWFTTTYATQIEKLRDVYDNVRVCWGVHSYQH